MIFKRLNRTSPEQVFAVFKAADANIVADSVVQLVIGGGTADGVSVIRPATAGLRAVVGISDAAIANGAYGLVQVYGYRSTSQFITVSSIAAGAPLAPTNAQVYLATGDTTIAGGFLPAFTILESQAAGTSVTVSQPIFIRCM